VRGRQPPAAHASRTQRTADARRPAMDRALALRRRYVFTTKGASAPDHWPTIVTPRLLSTSPIGFATAVVLLPA